MKQPTTFAYGVTTVSERVQNHLLKRTLLSLEKAGFDQPHLFLDGPCNVDSFGLITTVRNPKLHLSGNWILALWELYLRDPTAHRYIIFQDDIVVCQNLRTYLMQCPYEDQAYYNLCTYEQNEPLALGRTGWYLSNQKGRGAQALMFDRKALEALLGHKHLIARFQDKRRGPKSIDGAVCDSLIAQGWQEFVHNPSLVAHTSEVSTIGHTKQKCGASFRGENWNPLELGSEK